MNNKNEFQWHRMQKFAIRKFSVGAASVMIGSTLVGTLIPSAVHSDSPVLISTQILENESNIKRVLEFFADPATGKISGPNGVRTIDYSYSNVNAKVGEVNAEKANAAKRIANDYSPEAYTKYQSDLKAAVADLSSVQAMLDKAQEINGKAAAYLSEISSLIDSKRKDLAYNVVTQEEKKAINNRLIQIYNDINYMDQYKQTMVQLYDHLTALKNSAEELTYSPSQAKEFNRISGSIVVYEQDKMPVSNINEISAEESTKLADFIVSKFYLNNRPTISYENGNAVLLFADGSKATLPLVRVAKTSQSSLTNRTDLKKALAAATALLEKAKAIDLSEKTESSANNLRELIKSLEQMKVAADGVDRNPNSDQNTINSYTAILKSRTQNLESYIPVLKNKPADKSELNRVIDEATEALNSQASVADKTESSVKAYKAAYKALETARDHAWNVRDNSQSSQKTVTDEIANLRKFIVEHNNAKAGLQKKDQLVSKITLLQALSDATSALSASVDTSTKTPDSVQAYTTARTSLEQAKAQAERVKNNTSAKQGEVDTAASQLRSAINDFNTAKNGLKEKPVVKTSLDQALSDATSALSASVDTTTKTPDSVQAYTTARTSLEQAKAQAERVKNNTSAKQGEVDTATSQLRTALNNFNTAKNGLKEKPVVKTALDQALSDATSALSASVDTTTKTPDSVQAYTTARTSLEQAKAQAERVKNNASAKQGEVDTAASQLRSAINDFNSAKNGLKEKPVVKTALDQALSDATSALSASVDTSTKTADSVQAYTTARTSLEQAKAQAERVKNNASAKQGEVDTATSQLRSALNNFNTAKNGLKEKPVVKTALDQALSDATTALTASVDTTTKTADSVQAYTTARTSLEQAKAQAERVKNNTSAKQGEVDTAASQLRSAINDFNTAKNGLKEKPVVKTALDQALSDATNALSASVDTTTKTPDSVQAYTTARTSLEQAKAQAERVKNNTSAKQGEVDTAASQLRSAINDFNTAKNGLKEKPVVKTSLDQALSDATSALSASVDTTTKTPDSVQAYTTARTSLEQAKAQAERVKNNTSAKQGEVDTATSQLRTALNNFNTAKNGLKEKPVVKTALDQALSDATSALSASVDTTTKTPDSVQAYTTARTSLEQAKAQAERVKNNASAKQGEVDVATSQLRSAINDFNSAKNGLKEKPVVKTALDQALSDATTALSASVDTTTKTADSVQAYTTARTSLEQAKAQAERVKNNASAKQGEVDTATSQLRSALNNFNTAKNGLKEKPVVKTALDQALSDATSALSASVDTITKTADSVQAYTTARTSLEQAKAQAERVKNNASAKQGEVDTATSQLRTALNNFNTAKNGLKEKPVVKTSLDQALSDATNALSASVDTTTKTPDSVQAYTTARTSLEQAKAQAERVKNNTSAKQGEVDTATSQLRSALNNFNTAKNGLKEKPVVKTALDQALSDATSALSSSVDTTTKTADSVQAYTTARTSLEQAKAQAERVKNNASAKQGEVDTATSQLRSALNNFNTAKNGLKEKPVVKTALDQALSDATSALSASVDTSTKTADSVQAYTTARTSLEQAKAQAERVKNNASAKQGEVDTAASQLRSAINDFNTAKNGLKEKPVVKTALDQALSDATSALSASVDTSTKTPDSVQAYTTARTSLEQAKAQAERVKNNASAKQGEVDTAASQLRSAINDFNTAKNGLKEKPVVKTALDQALSDATTALSASVDTTTKTPDSVQAYTTARTSLEQAKAQAERVKNNASAKQGEVDTAASQLRSAINDFNTAKNGLKEKPVVKTALEQALSDATTALSASVDTTTKTADSVQAYTTARTSLEQAKAQAERVKNNASAKQGEVDAAASQLRSAINDFNTAKNGLKEKPVVKTALDQALSDATNALSASVDTSTKTPDSVQAYTTARTSLEQAKAQAERVKNNASAKQGEVDTAASQLRSAINDFNTAKNGLKEKPVVKTALDQALSDATTALSASVDTSTKTADSVQAYTTARTSLEQAKAQAERVKNNASAKQGEVDTAASQLRSAINDFNTAKNGLKEKPVVKTALDQALSDATSALSASVDTSTKTADSVQAYTTARTSLEQAKAQAERVKNNASAKQGEVDTAASQLRSAINDFNTAKNGLKEKPVVKTALDQALSDATSALSASVDTSTKTPDSVQAYTTARTSLEQAKAQAERVKNNASAKQGEVDTAASQLRSAINDFNTAKNGLKEKPVVKTALDQALSDATTALSASVDTTTKTPDSVQAYTTARTSLEQAKAQAERVKNNTSAKQGEVDTAASQLRSAINDFNTAKNGLKEKPVVKTALDQALSDATTALSVPVDTTTKTADSVQAYTTARTSLEQAKAQAERVKNNTSAKQGEVDTAASQLRSAINDFNTAKNGLTEKPVVKTALDQALSDATTALTASVDTTTKTADSVQAYTTARTSLEQAKAQAERVKNNTSAKQGEVDTAASQLRSAINDFNTAKNGLKEKPVVKTALDQALSDATNALSASVDTTTKTPDSVQAYTTARTSLEQAKAQAERVKNNTSAKQGEVDTAASQLRSAINDFNTAKNGLKEKPVVKTALDQALSDATSALSVLVDTTTKTADSVQAYTTARTSLEQAKAQAERVKNNTSAKQGEVDTAASQLRSAINDFNTAKNGLKEKPVVKTALDQALSDATTALSVPVDTTTKTADSVQAYTTARTSLEQAKAQAERVKNNASAKQGEVDTAASQLRSAINDFNTAKNGLKEKPVVKTALEQALSDATNALSASVDTTTKTPDSVQAYTTARTSLEQAKAQAERVKNNTSAKQGEVDTAASQLRSAINDFNTAKNGLKEKPVVKTALDQALSDATTALSVPVDTSTKTPDSVQAYTTARTSLEQAKAQAERVKNNTSAKQGEVDTAASQLRSAINDFNTAKNGLKEKPVVKTALDQALSDATTALSASVDTTTKTPDSVQAYTTARTSLEQAKAQAERVKNNASAKQGEVDTAASQLRSAINDFNTAKNGLKEKPVVKTALEQALSDATNALSASVDTTTKTPDSVQAYTTARTSLDQAKAQAERVKNNASAKQGEVDTAASQLRSAINDFNTAKNGLKEKPVVKTALEQALSDATTALSASVDTTTKTADSVQAYTTARTSLEQAKAQAERVKNNASAKQGEVDTAASQLRSAINDFNTAKNGLTEKPVVKTALDQALSDATTALSTSVDTTTKTADSVQAYTTARTSLEQAKAQAERVKNNASAKQGEVDVATSQLRSAINDFNTAKNGLTEKPVVKTALDQALSDATSALSASVDTSTKTPDSVQAYTTARTSLDQAKAQAEDVKNNASAKQGEVDTAVSQLRSAINDFNTAKNGLKDSSTPGQPGNNGGQSDPSTPGQPGNNGGQSDPSTPGQPGNNGGQSDPSTPGQPGNNGGQSDPSTPGQPGNNGGQSDPSTPGQPGNNGGQSDPSTPGQPGNNGGQSDPSTPGQPGNNGGQSDPSTPGQPGNNGGQSDPSTPGQPGNNGGQSDPSTPGQPGNNGGQSDPSTPGQPGNNGGQSDPSTPGQPGNNGGQSDPSTPGQPGNNGGQSDPSTPGQPGNNGGQSDPSTPGQPGNNGGQSDPSTPGQQGNNGAQLNQSAPINQNDVVNKDSVSQITPKVQDKKNLPNTGDIENIGLTSGLATLGIAAYVAAMRKRHKK